MGRRSGNPMFRNPDSTGNPMTILITSRAEWSRILANVQPSPLFVTDDREWFRDGMGNLHVLVIR